MRARRGHDRIEGHAGLRGTSTVQPSGQLRFSIVVDGGVVPGSGPAASPERRPTTIADPVVGAIAQLGERLVCNQEVTGSNPVGSIELRELGESDSRCLFPPNRSRTGPAAVVEGLPELPFVGPLITLEHGLGRLPAAELA